MSTAMFARHMVKVIEPLSVTNLFIRSTCARSIAMTPLNCLEQKPMTKAGNKSSGLIWEGYKRNFKGAIPPKRTRQRCKRGPKLCGNPCPICRNETIITHTDHQLLEQFICPHTGQILPASKTGLCRQQQKKLEQEVQKAWEHGFLPYPIPRELPDDIYRIPSWNQINIR